jgi:hypothetical protein
VATEFRLNGVKIVTQWEEVEDTDDDDQEEEVGFKPPDMWLRSLT